MDFLKGLSRKLSGDTRGEGKTLVSQRSSDDQGDVYLRGEFMAMDYDHTGVITVSDFIHLLQYLGVASSDRIRGLLKEVNAEESSNITVDEYYKIMEKHPEIMKQTSRMRDMFRKFDPNGDGQAYIKDMIEGFREMGVDIDDEIKKKIEKLDRNKDGKVKYQDFLRTQLEQKHIITPPK